MFATNRILMVAGAAFACASATAQAGTEKDQGLANIGDGVAIALPVAAAGISLWKDDWNGVGQLALDGLATVGTVEALKHLVKEHRPDYSDDRSFPSATSAVAFAPANYLWDRYGWQYGVPAYGGALFVGATRIISNQHYWWDVATSGVIALGYTKLFVSPLRKTYGIDSDLEVTPHSVMASLSYKW
ncbi:MAG TPA: phosphatase PAP2 family protein [Rhizomicrobium sp.]|jgi:membrane-associated phospholipid phosphatase